MTAPTGSRTFHQQHPKNTHVPPYANKALLYPLYCTIPKEASMTNYLTNNLSVGVYVWVERQPETQITKYRQSVTFSCSTYSHKGYMSCTWGVWSTNCRKVVTRPGHCYLLFSTTGGLLSGTFTCRTAHSHNAFILCARKPCSFHFKIQLKKQEQRRQLCTFIKFMYKASHLPLIVSYLFISIFHY